MLNSCKKATNILLSSYEQTALISGISDVVIVKWPDNQHRSTPFIVCFGPLSETARQLPLTLKINGKVVRIHDQQNRNSVNSNQFRINKYGYVQPFHPSVKTIQAMGLRRGRNIMQWIQPSIITQIKDKKLSTKKTHIKKYKTLIAQLYYFDIYDKIMISDFDGTMTKTDIKGIYNNFRGRKYLHDGYDLLIEKLVENGYRIIWITMRSITLYQISKNYIADHIGCEGILLPQPEQFFPSLKKQLMKKTSNIKTNMMKKIRDLYPPNINPFAGGLGNRQNDAIAYLAVGIPRDSIYLVNRDSEISKLGEMQMLSYQHILQQVQKHFPSIHRSLQQNRQSAKKLIEYTESEQNKIKLVKIKVSLRKSTRPVSENQILNRYEKLETQWSSEKAVRYSPTIY